MTENRLLVKANSKETLPFFMFEENGEFFFNNATKVLSVTAQGCVTDCEALSGELRVAVKTTFKAVFCTADGFDSAETTLDSTRSIKVDGLTQGASVVAYVRTVDCDYSGTTTLKAKATFKIDGWYIKECAAEIMENGLEGIHAKTVSVKTENTVMLNQSSLTVTTSNEARVPISQIMDNYACAVVNNVYPNGGSYQVEGEIVIKMLALNDSGQFTYQTFNIPYSTEISDESVTADATLDVGVSVCSVALTIADGDGKGIISDVNLVFNGCMTVEQTVTGIEDVYSTSHELSVQKADCSFVTAFCLRAVRDKVTEYVKVADGVNEVCGVCGVNGEVNAVTDGGVLQAEGVIGVNILYINASDGYSSVKVELPYVAQISKDYGCDVNFTPTLSVTNMSARVRTSSEIEVSVEYVINMRGKTVAQVALITGLEVGEEKSDDDVAISLYLVKDGESIWDVAKALNTEEATLIELNPDLKLPLKGGEKVLLYKDLPYGG